jgi:hypothetical protein
MTQSPTQFLLPYSLNTAYGYCWREHQISTAQSFLYCSEIGFLMVKGSLLLLERNDGMKQEENNILGENLVKMNAK